MDGFDAGRQALDDVGCGGGFKILWDSQAKGIVANTAPSNARLFFKRSCQIFQVIQFANRSQEMQPGRIILKLGEASAEILPNLFRSPMTIIQGGENAVPS